jgi:HEAT repeat protein
MGIFGPPNIDKMEKNRDIDGLLRALKYKPGSMNEEHWKVREAAIKALGRLKDPRSVQPLLNLFDGPSTWVIPDAIKATILEVLIGIGSPAVEALIAALSKFWTRSIAIEALVNIGDVRAVRPLFDDYRLGGIVASTVKDPLIKMGAITVKVLVDILDGKDNTLRPAAADLLGEIGDARAIEALCVALKDPDRKVHKAAIRALGKIYDSKVLRLLVSELKRPEADIRAAAQQALESFSVLKKDRSLEHLDVSPLVDILRSNERSICRIAAKVLNQLGWKPVTDEQKAWIWVSKHQWVKCQTVGSLAVEPLVAALEDPDEKVRAAAIRALGVISDERSVRPIFDIYVRNNSQLALDALKKMGAITVKVLVDILDDQDDALRRAAAGFLDSEMKWKPVTDKHKAWLWTSKHHWEQCQTLGSLAVEPLIAALQSERTERNHIVRILGEIGDGRAVYPLMLALNDIQTHTAAAQALVKLYQSEKLSAQEKQLILSGRGKIIENLHADQGTQIHTDWRSTDYRTDCHVDSIDNNDHSDESAYGSSFPL